MAKIYKSENAVFNLLKSRYPEQQYALMAQVADATGTAQSRWADAIAFGLWPSRGLEIEGFEIKVSRSDWLSELNDPSKSSAVQQFCHRWWIVAGSRKIVEPEELPATWGLMIPRGEGLEAKVKAPLLKPKKISRKFCAAVMRSAQRSHSASRRSVLEQLRKEAEDSAKSWALHQAKLEIDEEVIQLRQEKQSMEREISRLKKVTSDYESLEKTMGTHFRNWNMRRILEEVARNKLDSGGRQLISAIHEIQTGIEKLGEISEKLEAFSAVLGDGSSPPTE